MKFIKLFEEFSLNESLTDIEYHFTFVRSLYNILTTNQINLTPVFGNKSDNEINKEKLFALSLTTSRSSELGYGASLPKTELVRLTLDGRELNYDFKSIRVDYWKHPKDPNDPLYTPHPDKKEFTRDFYRNVSRQNELEDRIISDKNVIKPANKYIKKVEILNVDKEKAEVLLWLANKLNIPLYIYDELKYFDAAYKEKSLDINPKEGKLEYSESNAFMYIDQVLAMLVYKDPELKEKIYKKLEDFDIELNKLKDSVEVITRERFKPYISYPNEFYEKDRALSVESDIFNAKRHSNELFRYVIHQFGLDMKKHNTNTIKDYIHYKVWKGKKTQQEYNKEFNAKIIKLIDKTYNNYLNEWPTSYYDKDGNYHENIFEYKPVMDLLNSYINKIKKYCSDYILKNNDKYQYSYILSSREINENLNLKEKDFENVVDGFEKVDSKTLFQVIESVIWGIDNFYYNEVKRLQEEFDNQWNS